MTEHLSEDETIPFQYFEEDNDSHPGLKIKRSKKCKKDSNTEELKSENIETQGVDPRGLIKKEKVYFPEEEHTKKIKRSNKFKNDDQISQAKIKIEIEVEGKDPRSEMKKRQQKEKEVLFDSPKVSGAKRSKKLKNFNEDNFKDHKDEDLSHSQGGYDPRVLLNKNKKVNNDPPNDYDLQIKRNGKKRQEGTGGSKAPGEIYGFDPRYEN